MITASDEFKELWNLKTGREERYRLRYKRRYLDAGGAWTNEANWSVLKQEEGDFKKIGRIPQKLDSDFRSVFKIGNVNLEFPNPYNEMLEALVPPSFWAADGLAASGYRSYKTIWQIQQGYKLSDGTWEWLSIFTGVGLKPKIRGGQFNAVVTAVSQTHLLEKVDAEVVRDTDVTLENCIPATGDGSNKDFESTTTGVDRATDLQVNGSSLTKGDDYTTDNNNERVAPGNTGRLALTLNAAPTAGHTVKLSLIHWLKDNLIETILGLIFDETGFTYSVSPITFPGGVSGSQEVDSQAEWENGDTLQNIDSNSSSGSIKKLWNVIDDFSDGDYTADPVWTVVSGTPSISSGAFAGTSGDEATLASSVLSGKTTSGLISVKLVVSSGTLDFTVYSNLGFGPGGISGTVLLLRASTTGVSLIKVSYTSGIPTETNLGTITTSSGTNIVNFGSEDGGRVYIVISGKTGIVEDSTGFGGIGNFSIGVDWNGTGNVDDIFWNDYVYDASSGDEGDFPVTSTVLYESEEFDLLAAPAAWGTLYYVATLNGGTIAVETNVSSTSGSGYDGWTAIDSGTNEILSNLKRYLKVRFTLTVAGPNGNLTSPVVDSYVVNFTSTQIFISLAKHSGLDGLKATQNYLKLCDYELAVQGDGTVLVRAKDLDPESAVTLTQEHGIIDVTDYDDGIPNRAVKSARVRYGGFAEVYDGAAAGASAAVQAEETELGGKVIDEDISDYALALNVNLASAMAQALYENNRRSSTDPRPLRRLRLRILVVPWLELGDKVTLAFYDNPYMRQFQAADPLHKVGPYFNWGDPGNVLAKDQDFKVLEYTPDPEKNEADLLVEEYAT